MSNQRQALVQKVRDSDYTNLKKLINCDFYESAHCGYQPEAWKHSNDWACSFCVMLANMGYWNGDKLKIVTPEEETFHVLSFYDNKMARQKVLSQYLIQQSLPTAPNFILSAASCNGILRVLSRMANQVGWAGVDLAEVMKSARVLRLAGWSHSRAYEDEAVVWGPGVGFALQEYVTFSALAPPVAWVGNDVTFFQFRQGIGYAGYTEALLLLAAARARRLDARSLPEWREVFGDDGDLVYQRLSNTTDWNDVVVNEILKGIHLQILK